MEWQAARENKAKQFGGKCKVDEMYCAAVKFRYPDINISPDILYRKYKIPTDMQIKAALDLFIDGDYNIAPYGGKEQRLKGKRRVDVWNESIRNTEFRMASEANLDMLLRRVSRPQKISRNGVFVRIAGEKLWYYGQETILHIGEQVYVRYDPANPTAVRIYSMSDDIRRCVADGSRGIR